MIEIFVYGFFEKIFRHDRSARRNHLFEIVIDVVRRAEFDVNENSDFVCSLKQFFFRHDGMKPYEVKAEFLCLFQIFKIKFFERQS